MSRQPGNPPIFTTNFSTLATVTTRRDPSWIHLPLESWEDKLAIQTFKPASPPCRDRTPGSMFLEWVYKILKIASGFQEGFDFSFVWVRKKVGENLGGVQKMGPQARCQKEPVRGSFPEFQTSKKRNICGTVLGVRLRTPIASSSLGCSTSKKQTIMFVDMI